MREDLWTKSDYLECYSVSQDMSMCRLRLRQLQNQNQPCPRNTTVTLLRSKLSASLGPWYSLGDPNSNKKAQEIPKGQNLHFNSRPFWYGLWMR